MDTPILDFVRRYTEQKTSRLHMPGHKGKGPLGFEAADITEIKGADSLYEAAGIIRESEENASRLFGADSFYTTEGSSHAIRAMLALVLKHAAKEGRPLRIAATRNAHKSFLTALCLLAPDVLWVPCREGNYLTADPDSEALEKMLQEEHPVALYVTSPDYLGNRLDIAALASLCHRHGTLLLVDNAHGAYLHFLPTPAHPIDLGADLSCDSAHKTLPALTGAAYLHIAKSAPADLKQEAKSALALFGSTSPSYLTLASLDALNASLASDYPARLSETAARVSLCKDRLREAGYKLTGDEDLKITLCPKSYGYRGEELAELLREGNIEPEFADPDFLVLMPSISTEEADFARIEQLLCRLPRRTPVTEAPPAVPCPETVMTVREALFAPSEEIQTEQSLGRVFASLAFSCPPAVPVLVAGEKITEQAIRALLYYGIKNIRVTL